MSRPPVPERREHVHQQHGVSRPDPWQWLRDREDPAALAHLRAENAHTEAATAHLDPVRKRLYDEMLGRIQEDDCSVHVLDGGWWYYTRTEAGKAYPIHCRRRDAEGAPEQVILAPESNLAESQRVEVLSAGESDQGD